MWKFAGEIKYRCSKCCEYGTADISEFDYEYVNSYERQMGAEQTYEITLDKDCDKCGNEINFMFTAFEYPYEVLNHVESDIEGATSSDTPYFEYLDDLYDAKEFELAVESVSSIILEIKSKPEIIRDITPRQFEEIIAELFRSRGYKVELTQRTRDGGKDIIAISTDRLGIKLKYFIECKHFAETNKVGIGIVRALQGVKNTKDGPNKIIIATTSSFTTTAIKFANNEATSKWDIDLVDYHKIIAWVNDYSK